MSTAPTSGTSIRLAGVVRESIVDGPGFRFTIFVQGCPHHCPGCHNAQTHDPAGGYDGESERLLEEIVKNPLLRGVTFSGGEPIAQAEALLPLARSIRARGLDLVLFSGYTLEQLLPVCNSRPAVRELLSLCFLLVDGPYVEAERDLTLRFRGSRNQRLLDPVASLAAGKAIEAQV